MNASSTHKQSVIKYYDDTKNEYRFLWKSNQTLAIHFGYYDKQVTHHTEAVTYLNKKLAERIDIAASDIVLDAGCGVGGSSIYLAAQYGCRVIGANIVPWQLEYATNEVHKRHLEGKVNFINADYADTKLDAESISVFWGLESVVHAADKAKVVQEAYRLLKPGGRLIIAEYLINNKAMTKEDQQLIQTWLNGWAMPSLLTESQYRNILKVAGFQNIQFDDWTRHIAPSFARLSKLIKIFTPVAPALKKLRIVNEGQLNNLKASQAQMETLHNNIWSYKIITASKRK